MATVVLGKEERAMERKSVSEGEAKEAQGVALIHPVGAGALSIKGEGGPGCGHARVRGVRQRPRVSSERWETTRGASWAGWLT